MNSPRGTYGGGYYTPPSFFPDTPIYDSLVAERGTPQIAPIRVPSTYESASNLPALPAALPALPPSPSYTGSSYTGSSYTTPAQGTYTGYQQAPQPVGGYQQQPAGLQNTPPPYIPQQPQPQRNAPAGGYQGGQGGQAAYQQQTGPGYEQQPRPVPPRPAAPRQTPNPYGEEQYQRRNPNQGY